MKAGGSLATSQLPDFMRDDANAGKDNISAQDMVIPRVALMQAVNPQVTEGLAESGDFYHTIAEEVLGDEIDDLVILHHSKRYTLWNPRHAGGGVLARASDGKVWDADWEGEISPYKDRPKYKVKMSVKAGDRVGKDIGLGRWGTMDPENPDSPPAATLTHVLVCVSISRAHMGPFVVLLQRSAEPVAKLLLSKVNGDNAPIYGQVYTMGSRVQPSPSGEFNQYTFAKAGHVAEKELYLEFKRQHETFREQGVKVDDAAEQPEDPNSGGGAGAGPDDKDDKY